ncbi:MAG: hypothetical protein OEZ16_12240 [Chromatiales bacterium]|nr:hypothetical protein [Chromatiales bacterium]
MEIYGRAQVRIAEADLQRYIDVNNLPEWCASIEAVVSHQGSRGEIRTSWGEATIHRELINGGVRFSCPNNPYAMQWSITTDPAHPSEVLVHLSTNRTAHEAQDLERMELLVTDWRAGLEDWPQRRAARLKKPCANCGDSFGGFG